MADQAGSFKLCVSVLLHSRRDKLEAMDLDDYYDTYRLVAACLAFLDQVIGEIATARQRAAEGAEVRDYLRQLILELGIRQRNEFNGLFGLIFLVGTTHLDFTRFLAFRRSAAASLNFVL